MANLSQYGQWAAVLGAAEGIGKAFCEEIASHGINILLVDIKKDLASKISLELEQKYSVQTSLLIQDLGEPNAHEKVIEVIKEKDCRLVIHNAAYGPVKPFLQNSKEELDQYINVNSRTLLHLLHQLPKVWKGQKAGVIIMSSLAGLFGTQLVAPYSATKAFDINLGEALHYELKPQNIDVLVCCAGATDTPNFRGTNPNLKITFKPHVAHPLMVAKEAVNNLGKKALHIAGFQNRMNYFILNKVLPRKLASRIFNHTMEQLYSHIKKG